MKVAPQNLVVISVGANLGDARGTVQAAMQQLSGLSEGLFLRSSLWETEPVDCPPGSPPFINAVAAFVPMPQETPETLLRRLKKMEARAGRAKKKVLNEPRPLDLDIIAFQTELRSTPELTIPHPRAHIRAFVLGPLSEILPMLTLPLQTAPVKELFERLGPDERRQVRRLETA